ncbi:MAG: hypothetical protein QOK20_2388, partial [Acidimicrobiaceae bacterium]|nr:hypothetical protein [Acidimicrobiaceae bacterium]
MAGASAAGDVGFAGPDAAPTASRSESATAVAAAGDRRRLDAFLTGSGASSASPFTSTTGAAFFRLRRAGGAAVVPPVPADAALLS